MVVRSKFGILFRKAADNTAAQVKHDGFDLSVIEIKKEDLRKVYGPSATIPPSLTPPSHCTSEIPTTFCVNTNLTIVVVVYRLLVRQLLNAALLNAALLKAAELETWTVCAECPWLRSYRVTTYLLGSHVFAGSCCPLQVAIGIASALLLAPQRALVDYAVFLLRHDIQHLLFVSLLQLTSHHQLIQQIVCFMEVESVVPYRTSQYASILRSKA